MGISFGCGHVSILQFQKMYFVYILKSEKDNGHYISHTSNLKKRLKEHNSGKTRSLRHRVPLRLVHSEVFKVKCEAKDRERQIKSYKGGKAFLKLLGSPRFQRD